MLSEFNLLLYFVLRTDSFNRVILTFESMDEILLCDNSNETSSAVLSHGTICLVCSSNFHVYQYGVTIEMKLFSSTFKWYYSFSM